jgi:NNP family nitrate/nitrite transporter-like MFS transporter
LITAKKESSKYKWLILALMCFGIMSPQYAQYMMTIWGNPWLAGIGIKENGAEFAALSTAPLLPGALFSLVSGVLVDRFGLKKVLIICISISAAAIIARIWATSYAVMFICMALTGVAATFFNANQMKFVGTWFPAAQTGLALGIFVAFNNGSMALSSGVATLFTNYSSAFVSSGIYAAFMVVVWLILGRDKPKVPVAANAEAQPPILECLKVVVRSRRIWIMAVGMMLFQSAALTLTQFMPSALQADFGYTQGQAVTITNVFTFSALIGCLFTGKLFNALKRPKLWFTVIGIISAFGIAFAWRIPNVPLKVIALSLLGMMTLGHTPILTGLPLTFPEIGPKYAGTAGGFSATLMLAANFIIPTFVTMPLANNDYSKFFYFEAAIMVLFVIISPFMPTKIEQSSENREQK